MKRQLTIDDFAALFGTERGALPAQCVDLIEKHDWRYEPVEGEALDSLLRDFLDRIQQKNFSIVRPGDKARWIKGWSENLRDFIATNGSLDALEPKYIRSNTAVRLFGRFILPVQPRFELNWFRVLQEWLFQTYFSNCDTIFEFASGSGINVARLAQMFPEKKIIGLDWAEPACEIVEAMRRFHGWNTEARSFNFFDPDYSLEIPPNSIITTIGGLEQTSTQHDAFIDFLLAKRPKLCIFVEPIYEWYDSIFLADHLAIRAHEIRDFWRGFPQRLKSLESQGRAEIIKMKRSDFGSLLHEGYSHIIWRPV